MYKLKNKLFGWDYIQWNNSADNGIARVILLKDGKIGYWRYRTTCVFDEIKSPEQVRWLTCHPIKYFKIKSA
jgi:hypothetical protein